MEVGRSSIPAVGSASTANVERYNDAQRSSNAAISISNPDPNSYFDAANDATTSTVSSAALWGPAAWRDIESDVGDGRLFDAKASISNRLRSA